MLNLRSQIRDRVNGVLLGLAAGDRIGGPIKMAILLAESLIENSTYDSSDVEKRYIGWWSLDGFDTGIVSEKVFSLVSGGTPRVEAVNQVDQELNGLTAGCNPLHRCMPIAMCAHLQDEEISGIAEQESMLTHKHHIAGLISATSVQLARSLINGAEWSDAIMKLENFSSTVISDAFKDARKGKIYSDGYSLHVFSAAVHFVSTSNTFDEMLEKAIDFSGDANYCAVLAGSLGGARWGASSISNSWFVGLTNLDQIGAVANNLVDEW